MRSFRLLLGGQLANKALRFVAAAVLARALSPHDFGVFNMGIAVAGVCITAASLGLGEVGGREINRRPKDAGVIAGTVLAARFLSITAVVTVVGVSMVAAGFTDLSIAGAGCAVAIGTACTGEWFARNSERTGVVATGTAAGGVVALLGSLGLARLGGDAAGALVIFAIGEGVASLVCWRAAAGTRFHVSAEELRRLLPTAVPIGLSSLAVYAFYANVDTVILGALDGADDAGRYSAAYRVFLTLNMITIFAAYAHFPSLSRESPPVTVLLPRLRRTLLLLTGYGAVVTGTAQLAATPLLAVMFGDDFKSAGPTLVLLCVSVAWHGVGYPIGYNLIALGRSKRYAVGAATSGVVGIGLDFLLIPPFGMEGAALATTSSIACATFIWCNPSRLVVQAPDLLAVLVALSASAVLAVAAPRTAPVIGWVTIATGVIVCQRGRRHHTSDPPARGDGAVAPLAGDHLYE